MVNTNGKTKGQLRYMLRTRDKWLTPWQMRGRISVNQKQFLQWDKERQKIREALKKHA